jgi:CO/xanthine dehydrogenase Mo-binding subunit
MKGTRAVGTTGGTGAGAAVGRAVRAVDATERVTGRIDYVLDLQVPGMTYGRILRSDRPHARIRRLEASRALEVDGVVAVLTRADFGPGSPVEPRFGPVLADQPVVALDKVRYVGEPVAAVAAFHEDAAAEAVAAIEVEYEDLPAVFSVQDALAPGAPILHEQPPALGPGYPDIILWTDAGNVVNRFELVRGDVDAGFAQADLVVEDEFHSPAVQHVAMEPHVAVATFDRGRLVVWSSTQTPYAVRDALAAMFGLPASRVRVLVGSLGGGFGSKTYPKIEPLAAALAWKAGRPVKVVLSREEEFLTVTKHEATIRLRTGVMRDGRLVARQVYALFNAGAYADISPRLIKNGGLATPGPYRIPNVKVESVGVYTNLPPAGAFRGYGVSQAAWAHESQMDIIAERLGMDPLELRMRNILQDGEPYATGEPMVGAHFRALLNDVAAAIGWEGGPSSGQTGSGEGPVRRGKGLAVILKSTITPSTSTASVKLDGDGTLQILTSTVEMGQGWRTVVAQMAADALGLPMEAVHVVDPDTDVTPYDQTTSSSRSTHSMGRAVALAIEDVRRQLQELAAAQLEASPSDLEVAGGGVLVRGAPDRSRSFSELIAGSRRGNLLGSGTYATSGGLDPHTGQGVASVHWHQAAGAAEVEVDTETGKVRVLRFHSAVFAGRVIHPRQAVLQCEGSVLFGLGQALFEEMAYDHGHLVNANLSEYAIPALGDLPEISVSLVEEPDTNDIHGIGETGLPTVVPAVASAVARAVGVRLKDIPMTPERVLSALDVKATEGEGGTRGG